MDINILKPQENIHKGGLPNEGGPNILGRHDYTDD
jgi:hypothetical protein